MNNPKDPAKAFLGTGWAFPPQVDVRGDLSMVSYEDDIRQAIRIILSTTPGERVMRPDFGAGLNALMFEPINTTTMTLARRRVEEALTIWEPRIDRVSVKVTAEARLGRLMVEIAYRVRATNTFYNLVYPFYLLEGEQTR
jgi:phage baseplate assembly protein W